MQPAYQYSSSLVRRCATCIAMHCAAAHMMMMIDQHDYVDGNHRSMAAVNGVVSRRTHLDDDFSASVKLAQLVGYGPVVFFASRLVLVLQIIERSVYAAYLAMRPPLHAMPATEALQRSYRYVHCLDGREPQ